MAPLKRLTIPRLELQGAVLASRLYKTILDESRFQFARTVFFLESRIVLAWICSEERCFKPFVSIRIGHPEQLRPCSVEAHPWGAQRCRRCLLWYHCSKLNRKVAAWPDFLRRPEGEWPQDSSYPDIAEVEKEKVKVHVVYEQSKLQQPIDCKRFSSWRKLVRVTAYVLRFVWNLRACTYNRSGEGVTAVKPIKDGSLSPEELQSGEKHWIQECQTSLKDRLSKGELSQLSPHRDPEGVYRVGGRVDRALFSYETRHLSLLPREHWVSHLNGAMFISVVIPV